MWKRTQSRSEMTFPNDRGVEKDCGTISSSDWFPLSEINQTTRHRVDNSLFGQEIVNYSLSLAVQSNWSCSRGCPLLVVDMIFNPQRSPMVQWRSTMVRCNSEGCLRSMTEIKKNGCHTKLNWPRSKRHWMRKWSLVFGVCGSVTEQTVINLSIMLFIT